MLIFESSRFRANSESWNNLHLHCCAVFPTWQHGFNSHVWWMFEIKSYKRLSQVLVHFVIAQATLFTNHRISGLLPMRAKYKHFRSIFEQTFDNSPTDFSSASLNWWSSMDGAATMKSCWVVLFASSKYLSTHFLHALPCHRTTKKCSRQVSLYLVCFLSCSRDSGIEHAPVIVNNIFACFTFSLSAPQVNVVKEWCRFSQIKAFHGYFPHWVYVLFLSSQFDVIHTYRLGKPLFTVYE